MSLDLFNGADIKNELASTATKELTLEEQRKLDSQLAADAQLSPADLQDKHDAALEAARGKESELMKEKGTEKAPEKKPNSVDLDEVKRQIDSGLEGSWRGIKESQVINALLSVPSHQMDELMEMYGGKEAFRDIIEDIQDNNFDSFTADEKELIMAKLDADVTPERFARALKDGMKDTSVFRDDAQPEYVVAALKSMSKSELEATVKQIGVEEMIATTRKSWEYSNTERLQMLAQIARVDQKGVDAIVGDMNRMLTVGNWVKYAASWSPASLIIGSDPMNIFSMEDALDTMKEVGAERVFAAAEKQGIDLKDKMLRLAQLSQNESVKHDIWTMAYGKEIGEAFVQADRAFGEGDVDGFVQAYGALSEADKKEFLAQFGKVMPQHGSTIERAINGNFNYASGGAERWAKMAQAIHPDAAIPTPEHMQDVGWGEYADAERELNRLGWQRLKGDTELDPQPDEAIAKKEEEPKVKTGEELKKGAESETGIASDPEQDAPILIDPNSPRSPEKTMELAKIGQEHKIIFNRIKDPVLRGLVEDFAIAYDSKSQEAMTTFHNKLYQLDPEILAAYSEKIDSWTPKGTQRSYQQGFKQTFASDVMLASQRNIAIDGQRNFSKVA